ncbi:MAG: sigma-70 family RNA polymerase sigma factor [Sedimentisphaerales bacterium]|nr:sigma-70 family RNA polymerase sigma factor [Sedimentisphaerales bacterium]
MKYSERAEVFRQFRSRYLGLLTSVLWKLTGDRELFAEAMQNALLGIWQNVEKLTGRKAGAYIYRIALTANSKAWRNRIGKDGQISRGQAGVEADTAERVGESESAEIVRRAISQLPERQSKALVMRYLEQQDYKDISAKLGCTEAGARSNVSKAVASLKKKLASPAEWK